MAIKKRFKLPSKRTWLLIVSGVAAIAGVTEVILGYPSNLLLVYTGILFAGGGGIVFLILLKGQGSLFGERELAKAAQNKEGLIRCYNMYPKKMGGDKEEYMEKDKVCPLADYWEYTNKNKMYLVQVFDGMDGEEKKFKPFTLPDEISYPPERYARIIGCEPLQRLKSLKFGWLEQLAPFAPVVALLIGLVLFAIVVG